MNYSGKLVTVAMIAVALAAAAFSLWYHQRATARALAYWGPHYAELFARAPSAKASKLTVVAPRAAPDEQSLTVDGRSYAVGRADELSRARGFENIRRMFLEDVAYEWDKPAARSPRWRYLLRFSDRASDAGLVLTEDGTSLRRLNSDSAVMFNPSAAREIAELLRDAFGDRENRRPVNQAVEQTR